MDQTTRIPVQEIRPQVTKRDVVREEPHYWQYCVNCGTLLDSRKCKLICHKCGFYHSCSEP